MLNASLNTLEMIQIPKLYYWIIIEIEKSNKNFEYRHKDRRLKKSSINSSLEIDSCLAQRYIGLQLIQILKFHY